jgi:hypothetical protein
MRKKKVRVMVNSELVMSDLVTFHCVVVILIIIIIIIIIIIKICGTESILKTPFQVVKKLLAFMKPEYSSPRPE